MLAVSPNRHAHDQDRRGEQPFQHAPGMMAMRLLLRHRLIMDSMATARPHMIATLDTFRDTLEGDTDPVSGPVVMEMK